MEKSLSLTTIVAKIKTKRELRGVADAVVIEFIEAYCKRHQCAIESISPAEVPFIIKEVRASLRRLTGGFSRMGNDESSENILARHVSTKERSTFYPELKERLQMWSIQSILDLGCGLNPLALATPAYTYHAVDINQDSLAQVDHFFKEKGIQGSIIVHDIRKGVKELPEVDLVLLMKVVDLLERKGHKVAEKIIKEVRANYLIISFSTKTLSGRPMNHPQRGWIEQLLNRLEYSFECIVSKNEIYYYVDKSGKK